MLEGLDVLVLDALRKKPHATNFCVEESLAVIEQLKPKRALLTHISHDLEHVQTEADLPEGVGLAYDGLRLSL